MGRTIHEFKEFQGRELLVESERRGTEILKKTDIDAPTISWSELVLLGLSGTIVDLEKKIEALERANRVRTSTPRINWDNC